MTRPLVGAILLVAGLGAANGGRPLEKTYWKATDLGGVRVGHIEHVREPHLVFDAGRLSGADGCNRITAGYTLRGDRIHVATFAATRMACEDTPRIERAFAAALTGASWWRIEGGVLELFDAKHARLARFEAQTAS